MSQAETPFPEQIVHADSEAGSFIASKWKVIVGGLVFVVALGYFAFMAFQSATVYYYTVSEISHLGATPEGKFVRVSGKLIPETFHREQGSTVAMFSLTDGTATMPAVHNGVVPDLFFNEHSEIVLEGVYSTQGVFETQNVIVKCPSKYIAEDEQVG